MNEDAMWEIIDGWFEKNLTTNEAIKTAGGQGYSNIDIMYARIQGNKLIQKNFSIEKKLLCKLYDTTVIAIMANLLEVFRSEK
jgi:hypothetical protein